MSTQLIFLGAPGSGKGTQAEKLADKGFKHVSTGDLLRDEIKKGSDLGRKVESILKAGNLVDDQTVLELLRANCKLDSSSYIFDGFPRNLEQAEMLDSYVLDGRDKRAVYFKIDPELLVERLTNRRTCKKCSAIYNLKFKPPRVDGVCDKCGEATLFQRDDDKEGVIRNRLNVYSEAISPVLDYYLEKGCLLTLDAEAGSDKVYESLSSVLGV